jgi:hypothetical protein
MQILSLLDRLWFGGGVMEKNKEDAMNIREMQEKTNKFFGNQGQTLYDGDQPVLNRIADALEKIARELERGNKLKALSLRHKYEIDNDHIDEIMEE